MKYDFLAQEAESYYHMQNWCMSSHRLADFRRSPALYAHKQLHPEVSDKRPPAFVLGSAAHKLILEGEAEYEKSYAWGGPLNPKTGAPYGSTTKAFAEWAESVGREVLTTEQHLAVVAMSKAVGMHKHASRMLSGGQAEGVIRMTCWGIDCQIRIDYFSGAGIVDLKTCADIDRFERDFRSYGYANQLAFYRSVAKEKTGMLFSCHIVAVEKVPPYRCGVWRIGEGVLNFAEKQNKRAIEAFKRSQEKNDWPTGYEDVRELDMGDR